MKSGIKFFSGEASRSLAENIVKCYGTTLGKSFLNKFSDGEFQPGYEETIRGDHVFIVQSTFAPTENLFELLLMIDAAKRASAYKVIAVIPYFGFARQDRKDQPRVSIAAKMVADLLNATGVDRVMTMDLHADQIQGFFDVPVDHIYASSIFIPYIKDLHLDNLVVASPDTGGTKRANIYAKRLDVPMVIGYKLREKANEVRELSILGDVEGKNVILLDDIVDTAGTLTKAADVLMEKGAKSVRAMVTHAVLSGPAYERIEKSGLEQLIVTDSIPLKKDCPKIKQLPCGELFAKVIDHVYHLQSISNVFIS